MDTTRHAGYTVPILDPGPIPLGRYANWGEDETRGGDPHKGPNLWIGRDQFGVDREARRAAHEMERTVAGRDGFYYPGYPSPDPFNAKRWAFDGKGLGVRRVSGGDFVSYVTCPSVSVAAGSATAASVSIQVLPNGVSPLFAGAGGATGGTGGFWYPGRTIQYTFMGAGTTSTSPGSTVFQANLATSQNVTTGVILGNSATTVALAASLTNISFVINGWATCRTIGTGGTIIGMGTVSLSTLATTNVTNMLPANTPATVTIDTTANSAINFLLTLGATTVAFTVHQMIWQVMN